MVSACMGPALVAIGEETERKSCALQLTKTIFFSVLVLGWGKGIVTRSKFNILHHKFFRQMNIVF